MVSSSQSHADPQFRQAAAMEVMAEQMRIRNAIALQALAAEFGKGEDLEATLEFIDRLSNNEIDDQESRRSNSGGKIHVGQ